MYNFNILLGVCGKGLQHDDVKVLMFINVKKQTININLFLPFLLELSPPLLLVF